MQEISRDNQIIKINSLILIFIVYLILILLFQYGVITSYSITIHNITLPAFQTTQTLIVFPLILIISYIFIIRKGDIKWQDLGFFRGNKGIINTILLGLLGGLAIGVYDYIAINNFLLQTQVIANFIEKCVFAPIWEEFFNRVLVLTIIEITFLNIADKFYFENPKYKDKITDKTRKYAIWKLYFIILFINGMFFVWFHNILISSNLLLGGMIMGAVYLKTRSIIAPIIVHSMSNFVTGGFLFLIMHYL